MKEYNLIIPTWAICAIVNGNYDTLTAEEEKNVNDFMNKYGCVMDINSENYFSPRNDIDGWVGDNVCDCTFYEF